MSNDKPLHLVTTASLDEPRSVYLLGDYAYITSYVSDRLEIIDVSNTTNPVRYGTISMGEFKRKYKYEFPLLCDKAEKFMDVKKVIESIKRKIY